MYSIINSFKKQGMFDIKLVEEMFSPLFRGKDVSLSITMKEFYEYSKIDIHLYCTELAGFKYVDISHKTHPDWKVIDAVYASSALPLLFAPFLHEGKYYIDGGIFLNYPIHPCIHSGADKDEILGILRNEISPECELSERSTLFDYILLIFNKTLVSIMLNSDMNSMHVPNEIKIDCYSISIYDLYMLATSQEERMKFIEKGAKSVIKEPITP
jgi:predicted acylesterase/phospholipase RssA